MRNMEEGGWGAGGGGREDQTRVTQLDLRVTEACQREWRREETP